MRSSEFTPRPRAGARDGAILARVDLADDGDVVLGLVTPKRIGSAVSRNRARRRVRAVVREMAATGELPPGRYVVSFNTTPPASPQAFRSALRSALLRALARAKR